MQGCACRQITACRTRARAWVLNPKSEPLYAHAQAEVFKNQQAVAAGLKAIHGELDIDKVEDQQMDLQEQMDLASTSPSMCMSEGEGCVCVCVLGGKGEGTEMSAVRSYSQTPNPRTQNQTPNPRTQNQTPNPRTQNP